MDLIEDLKAIHKILVACYIASENPEHELEKCIKILENRLGNAVKKIF